MKKIMSLFKATLSENMNMFKYKSKSKNKVTRKMFPIILALILFVYVWGYANMIMEKLIDAHLEIVLLTLFGVITSLLTIFEGIYKSSSLLFNCKDDNLLLSLPIRKSTVLFIRLAKLYLFELLYNSLFLTPAMLVYARYANVHATYYIVCIVSLFLLPIVPIVISCIIGEITSFTSSKFKFKNIVQIIVTTIFILIIMYGSFNIQKLMTELANKGDTFNQIVNKIYYPVGQFINLVLDFNVVDLLIYIGIHLVLFIACVFGLSKTYYKINSRVKVVKTTSSNNKGYEIKKNGVVNALIKKDLNRFINSPVFVINAGFGLVLFLVGSIAMSFKFDGICNMMISQGMPINVEALKQNIPVIIFGFVCLSSLLTSITSSMISLEGKSFYILKSVPIKPTTIINSKVLTAVLIMMPFIIVGDIVLFINFHIELLQMVLILLASIVMPLISETIGIIVNIKYPKMNAENDTEIVKQSMSSMVAVFIGMISIGLIIAALYKLVKLEIETSIIMISLLIVFCIIYIGLLLYLKNKGTKEFNIIDA